MNFLKKLSYNEKFNNYFFLFNKLFLPTINNFNYRKGEWYNG